MSVEFFIIMFITIYTEFVKMIEIYCQNIKAVNILSLVIPVVFMTAVIYEIYTIKRVYGTDKKNIAIHLITAVYLIVYAVMLFFTEVLLYAT